MKKTTHSKVMTIANRLVTQGYNRANAMAKAWVLVKMPLVETKVAGVTYGKRQKAIEHLSRYKPEEISITLHREQGNSHDANAVAVVASVAGKGSYTMGYLPRALAAFVAPLLDAGKAISSAYKEVRGLYAPYMNYGLAITLEV
jgi:ADP-ribosylglycohydrolase